MSRPPKSSRSESLRQRLLQTKQPVRYDVERGLERHRQLVAQGAELPAWAEELPAPRPGAGHLRGWLAGVVVVVGIGIGAWSLQDDRLAASTMATTGATRGPSVIRSARVDPEPAAGATASSTATRASKRDPATATAELVANPAAASAGLSNESARAASTDSAAAGAGASSSRVANNEGARAAAAAASSRAAAPAAPVEAASRELGTRVGPRTSDAAASASAAGEASTERASRAREPASTRAGKKARAEGDTSAPRDAEEMRQVRLAEQLLATDAVRALRLVRAGNTDFRGGYFAQERGYIELMALFVLGRHAEAHAKAAWFLRDYPSGPYRNKVELQLLKHPLR